MKVVLRLCIVLSVILLSNGGLLDRERKESNKRSGVCPAPKSLMGDCTFVSGVNCLNDSACPDIQKCCREGCNKICKAPIKEMSLPDFAVWQKWKSEKMDEWREWADETKKLLIQKFSELYQLARTNEQS